MTTYERLYEIVSPKLISYRNDLEKHDRETLEKWDGPFLYGYRPTGTSILKLGLKLEEWFGSEMTYRPIFGDKKYLKDVEEACDVLEQELLWIVPGADNKWFLHFDGKKFHEITKERVGVIWKAYVYGLKMSAPFKMDKSLLISA
jgi:hypothetical protein